MRRHLWLIPLAALLALSPLILGGPSCGKDFGFHIQSWFDAANQLRHLTLYPRWTFAAAYNSGEPRFTFYPPISWELGGLLSLILPFSAVPLALAWIALCLAGFSMHRLAGAVASPTTALLAACLYLANPFMLFSIAARSAFGEIFTAALCPLLVAAMLTEQPSLWAIGLPLGLMWLTNIPGGIIAACLFALLAIFRLTTHPARFRSLLPTFAAGSLAALGIAAIYLLPALVQHHLIRVEDAFTPGLRVTDNLLLHRTLLHGRDDFLLQIQHIAFSLAAATLLALAATWLLARFHPTPTPSPTPSPTPWKQPASAVLLTTLTILFLITFLSAPLWAHVPGLWIIQFPWRWTFVLGITLALAAALLLRNLNLRPLPEALLALALTASLAIPAIPGFRQPCGASDLPNAIRAGLLIHHDPEPVDEYIPAHTHPGAYRPDNPPFWLSPDPTGYAPNTTPNTIDANPDDMMPQPPAGAQLSATPLNFSVSTPTPTNLILNLEDYPNWRLTLNTTTTPTHLPRPDGLIAIPLPTGASTIAITWRPAWDERLGTAISLLTLLTWLLTRRRTNLSSGR